MLTTGKTRKVPLVSLDWSNGYLDKFLVITRDYDIRPIAPPDVDKLAPTQQGFVGDILIRVRHMLNSDIILEDHYLLDSPTTWASRTKRARNSLPVIVKACIAEMRDPANKMIPALPKVATMEQIKYDCNVTRKARFIKVLERADAEMYKFIVEQLKYSRNDETPGDWRSSKVRPLPTFLNIRDRLVVDSNDNNNTVSHTSQHWLLMMEDGTLVWDISASPTSGAVIDSATGKTIKVYNDAAKPLPSGVKRAIKFTIGLHYDNGEMLGVGWSLYCNTLGGSM